MIRSLPTLKDQERYFEDRLNTIKAINHCFEEMGIPIAISEKEWMNQRLLFTFLPIQKVQVYWLTATKHVSLDMLAKVKYRMDITMGELCGYVVEGNTLIARNEKYLVVIEPEGIQFDEYIKKLPV